MRVGVNTRLLLKGKLEGIGYFQQQLLKIICSKHPNDEFIFFFDRKYDRDFIFSSNIKPVVIPLPTRHPVLWKIYFDFLLPIYCKIYKIDVFFSPENYIPKLKSLPVVCTIHDINFFHNNNYIGNNSIQRYFMNNFPSNAEKSTKIVTVSEFSKNDIISSWNIEPNKVSVVYNAANELYKPKDEDNNIEIKRKYTGGEDFFYFVGAIHKRKNLENIFKAFDIFKNSVNTKTKLVIIGQKKWWKGDIENAYNQMKNKQDVIFTGRLQAEEVANLSSASLGLVFPSLFEGFGIPIVEAFACNTPVITSNTTSLPEVAGDAALLVNPYDAKSIAKAMQDLYTDNNLRQQLIEKGCQRNKIFNWNNSAEKLWNVILSAVK